MFVDGIENPNGNFPFCADWRRSARGNVCRAGSGIERSGDRRRRPQREGPRSRQASSVLLRNSRRLTESLRERALIQMIPRGKRLPYGVKIIRLSRLGASVEMPVEKGFTREATGARKVRKLNGFWFQFRQRRNGRGRSKRARRQFQFLGKRLDHHFDCLASIRRSKDRRGKLAAGDPGGTGFR